MISRLCHTGHHFVCQGYAWNDEYRVMSCICPCHEETS
jgi:hypothetical protein